MAIVEYFQRAISRGRRRTVAHLSAQLELQPAEVTPVDERALLQHATADVEDVLLAAFAARRLNQDLAAGHMLISASLLGRQLRNEDNQHVSLQRLWLLPPDFWREFIAQVIERKQLARVGRYVEGL